MLEMGGTAIEAPRDIGGYDSPASRRTTACGFFAGEQRYFADVRVIMSDRALRRKGQSQVASG
jgi:hypothetical protein